MAGSFIAQLAEGWIYMVALIFARIGTAALLIPGFGDTHIPPRAKISFGIAISIALMPALPSLEVPKDTNVFVLFLALEVLIGVFIGVGARLFMAAFHILGAVIGFAAGLSNSLAPYQGSPESGSTISTLLTFGAVACIFLTNTHHVILTGLMRSYVILPPGQVMIGDLTEQIVRIGSSAFYIAAAIGAPFFALSLLLNLGMGLANRVMPAMQVFFVASPGLIIAGFALLSITVPAILTYQNEQFAIWFETLVR